MAGTIRLDGAAVRRRAAERRVRRGIGYVPQEHAIFAKLTVRENLLLGCDPPARPLGHRLCARFLSQAGAAARQTAGTLSGGERKMLAIGRAVLGPAETPDARRADRRRLGRRHRGDRRPPGQLADDRPYSGRAAHRARARLAQYAYVMDRGSIALEGPSTRSVLTQTCYAIFRREARRHPSSYRHTIRGASHGCSR